MNGKTYVIGGKEQKLYTIGELCRRLDRQRQTIRKWERYGYIPSAQYRSKTNRRLYTETQINAIVRVVEKYGIKQGVAVPNGFREEMFRAFSEASEIT